MSTKEFLTNILGLPVTEERPGFLSASVPREKFSEAIDELVNVRGLAAQMVSTPAAPSGLVGVGLALAHLYATDDRAAKKTFGVHAVLHDDTSHTWLLLSTTLPEEDPTYPSVTRRVMAAHWYERWIRDMFGIEAIGHPDPRRLVHHENVPEGHFPLRKDFMWNAKMEQADIPYPMHAVDGEGILEIPVGPIHAGIIEPSHFRFNVAGERIITLESKLFFTHKGVEKLLENKTASEAVPFVERISGDAAVSHSLAFAQAVETLAACEVSPRAHGLRTLLNELERATMHIHDLANMGGLGTSYTVVAAHGFRIKERLMRLSDELFGNRFWRGMVVPGGVARDVNANELQKISIVVSEAIEEMLDVVALALQSDGLRDRLETTGVLRREAALAYGAVGVAARGSGVDRDVRRDHPYAAYDRFVPTISVKVTGDVYARFLLRADELKETKRLIQEVCKSPGEGRHLVPCEPADGRALGAVEGWRGETLHMVYMKGGKIERHVVRDPSFCNWALFGEIAQGNIVPDFPLCNESLNLSCSGTDL
ncbi:MAG: NADH-quinone oxidoreductase subunit C [Patescibacteria group bacterium]